MIGRTLTAISLAVAFGAAIWSPASADGVVVSTTSVEATKSDGGFTAKASLVNPSTKTITLPGTIKLSGGCDAKVSDRALAGLSAGAVTLAFDEGCFGDRSSLKADLDGEGPMPAVTIKKPNDERDWNPLLVGAVVAFVAALGTGIAGRLMVSKIDLANKAKATKQAGERAEQFEIVKAQVKLRIDQMGPEVAPLNWTPELPGVDTYRMSSVVRDLEAGWSFKESWAANLTVATTAVVALLSSADTLTALLGEEPKAAIGVMTVAGLIGAAIIVVGNTIAKLVGSTPKVVTVGGLLMSTACVIFAAGLQVVTVGLSVVNLVGDRGLQLLVALATLTTYMTLLAYAHKSLRSLLEAGAPISELPTVPAGAVTEWAAGEAWEKSVVRDHIANTYAAWLVDAPALTARYPRLRATSSGDDVPRRSMI